ncbi:D-amino-acid oxidase [Cordyceps fumosorosea ARSEF 2679]|uniref:D-amino-acid oxidase n=1 Tax=Cordyceps fumosorosea (strain ARSEF 2679) TaxID=1081104 RepID=A0A168B2K9_CORFA|nr:D-amino-acid oxidase [Cordyceps fumosorosea ARSEF 2679]OAA69531.1 D-amino-acid oxidase [Cordyceps fumosorosea ARSEF 2679]
MSTTIVVVGGGVSGLTSAYLLSKSNGNTVTLVAKHMPGDYDIEYASPVAGANVMPMSSDANSRWERRTWPEFEWLCRNVPEAGFHFKNTLVYRKHKDLDQATASMPMDPLFDRDPWYRHLMPDYRELTADELPPGQDSGCSFTSVCMNTPVYLSWLVGQCLRNGVVFRRAVLSELTEAARLSHAGRPADIVVNATGLGALKLGGVRDAAMAPARGQIVLVRNDGPAMVATSGVDDGSGEVLYAMQRAAGGGTILGGTYDIGNWESQPCPNIAARVMDRIVRLDPALAGGRGVAGLDVIRHAVGLRPYRAGGVRIERETLRDAAGGGSVEVVHNYGHAGWGYQGSFGCAERVVELVNEIRAARGEDLSNEPRLFNHEAAPTSKL